MSMTPRTNVPWPATLCDAGRSPATVNKIWLFLAGASLALYLASSVAVGHFCRELARLTQKL